MTRRYFVPELPPAGGVVGLDPSEARHAVRVMRVAAGDRVTLFDGQGHEASAEIIRPGRDECLCHAGPRRAVDRELPRSLVMAVALPRPERAREMAERLSELGVSSLVPLVTARTQRPPAGHRLERLRRAVAESCKQCGRNRLMRIEEPLAFARALELPGNRWLLDPGGRPVPSLLAAESSAASPDLVVLVGPEGGWSDDELGQAGDRGVRLISLGPRIYRIETAAVAVAAVVATHWEAAVSEKRPNPG